LLHDDFSFAEVEGGESGIGDVSVKGGKEETGNTSGDGGVY